MTASSIPRARGLVLALALALGVSASLMAMADEPPLPPPRPPELGAPAKGPEAPPVQAPPVLPLRPQRETPLQPVSRNSSRTARAQRPRRRRRPRVEGCGIDAPVRLSSITVEGDAVSLPDRPLVACEFALALADYVRLIVAPLGQAMLHAKVGGIETGPGYTCRTQDHIAGAKISAHAKGLAVDFVAIAFADKRRVLVERQTGADEASYFRAIRTAACGWFTTVLGPGSNSFHANNLHLDIESHGSSGSYRICQ